MEDPKEVQTEEKEMTEEQATKYEEIIAAIHEALEHSEEKSQE